MAYARKILTVIPARGGSRGIKHKNLRALNAMPLISYMIEAAKAARHVGKLIVSTDDEDIARIAESYGAEIPFIRPPELATGTTTLILVMRHALHFFDKHQVRFDAVMSLQPTSPFIKSSTIDAAIEKFHVADCEAVATVCRVRHGHPYVCKRLIGSENDEIEDFVQVPEGAVLFPRQKREPAYYFTGAIYLRDRKLIKNFKGRDYGLGKHPRVIITDVFESVDIDEMMDLKIANAILQDAEKKNGTDN